MTSKKNNPLEIKQFNRSIIYNYIRNNEDVTKQDIVSDLKLSLPTITQNITQLLSEGLIKETGFIKNTGGRPAKAYNIVKDARTAIGIDITKNHITLVAVDLKGKIIDRLSVKQKYERTDQYYKYLGTLVKTLTENAQLDEDNISGVGFAVPGLISKDGKTVFYGEILNFTKATLSEFTKYVPYETALFNDAKASSFTEIWANKDINNAFYIMLSNNVGGSVIINRQVYTGDHTRSGEVGHLQIIKDGKLCYCGQQGCVDTYCAATVLSELTKGNLSDFFSLLESGDEEATSLWDDYLEHLAITANNVHMLFDCDIILGGYIGEYIGDYIDDLRNKAKDLNSFADNADYLKESTYKKDAIAAGAALHFISGFLDSI